MLLFKNRSFRSLKWTCLEFRSRTLFVASLHQGADRQSECRVLHVSGRLSVHEHWPSGGRVEPESRCGGAWSPWPPIDSARLITPTADRCSARLHGGSSTLGHVPSPPPPPPPDLLPLRPLLGQLALLSVVRLRVLLPGGRDEAAGWDSSAWRMLTQRSKNGDVFLMMHFSVLGKVRVDTIQLLETFPLLQHSWKYAAGICFLAFYYYYDYYYKYWPFAYVCLLAYGSFVEPNLKCLSI